MVHWYKRDPDAALAGMIGLTMEERGAYNTLLDLLYSRDGNVPDDDRFTAVAQQCDVRTWRRLSEKLKEKGKIWGTSAGLLAAKRVEVTLNEARSFSELQANRARTGWEKRRKINENNGTLMPTAAMQSGNASTTTTTLKEKEEEEEKEKNLDFEGKQASKLTTNGQFYAKLDSPEQHAWERYRNWSVRDRDGGWHYPSQWPPGHPNAEPKP